MIKPDEAKPSSVFYISTNVVGSYQDFIKSDPICFDGQNKRQQDLSPDRIACLLVPCPSHKSLTFC